MSSLLFNLITSPITPFYPELLPIFADVFDLAGTAVKHISAFYSEGVLLGCILVIFTYLAVQLGQKIDKRVLTLESLLYFTWALRLTALFYLTPLLYGGYIFTGPLLNGYFYSSQYIFALKLLVVLCALFIFHCSEEFVRNHRRALLEFPLLLALALLFMLLLIGAHHLLSAFFCIAGFSLSLYILIFADAHKAVAREAGVKYYYLSTFSTGLILYGTYLLYAISTTGNFEELAWTLTDALQGGHATLLKVAVLFMLVGLFFKLSAFPGHLWAADVYEGAPLPITAFFMLPVKVAVLAFFIRFLTLPLGQVIECWAPYVSLAALGSLLWGCFAALQERNIRRFLAYASINQMGFLLIGISCDTVTGYRATLIYLFIYALMSIAFLAVFLLARREDGHPLLYLTDFRTIGQRHWAESWVFALALFSMAGIPPLAGFFGKYTLLLHAMEKGLYVLLIAGLFTSLISTYYYLRIVKILWFEGDEAMTDASIEITPQTSNLFSLANFLIWTSPLLLLVAIPYFDALTVAMLQLHS